MKEKRLASGGNPKVRFYRSLEERDVRRSTGLMAVEGMRLVGEALRSNMRIREIFLSDDLGEAGRREIMARLGEGEGSRDTVVHGVPGELFRRLAHTVNPQGVAAAVEMPGPGSDPGTWQQVVILHQPQDPGNVGAIVRSVEAAGFDGLILTEPACDPFGPKAARASMGSIFRLPVRSYPTLDEVMGRLGGLGFHLLAAVPRAGVSLYEMKISQPLAVIFGGEGAGLPDLPPGSADLFSLPMRGMVESLNLAQAATVVLYELFRQRIGVSP